MLQMQAAQLPSSRAARGTPALPVTNPASKLRMVRTSFMQRRITSQQTSTSTEGAVTPVEAFQNGTLSFGFSAGGLLFPYYVGVADQLMKDGILKPDTPMAGASAGSLIVACVKSGLPMAAILDASYVLAADCRDNGTRFRLKLVLDNMLRELLPEDIHHRCNGSAYVAVTRLFPALHPELAVEFDSREDCIQALLTSCWIPWYFSGDASTQFRGRPHTDGGVTNFLPNVPHTHTVRVCCLPRQQLTTIPNIHISPDAFRPWEYSIGTMLGWALEPADPDTLALLHQLGQQDAATWAERTGVAAAAAAAKAAAGNGAGAQQRLVGLGAGGLAGQAQQQQQQSQQPSQQQTQAAQQELLLLSSDWPGAFSRSSSAASSVDEAAGSGAPAAPSAASLLERLPQMLVALQQKK